MSSIKLTKENLQFIDTYLENSEVVYTDVRMELVDHVASAIEVKMEENSNETFYEVFKSYMIVNKKSLLKNVEEQKTKLRDKIFMRFGKGFLKTDILFLMLLALIVPSFIELSFSEDVKLGVNFVLCLIMAIYYFTAFHKTKKTSVGKGLGVVIAYAIYLPVYIKNPIVLLFLIPVSILSVHFFKYIKDKFHEGWSIFSTIMLCVFILPLFVWVTKWSDQYVTGNILESYFFFQLIMWYVLFKTLMSYKKELDIKYKGIFS